MQRFLLKGIFFCLPLTLLILVDVVLPMDFFTYRIWEAIIVMKPNAFLPGPFYPNITIEKEERPDLALLDPSVKTKKVRWITDRYGFRKKDSNDYYPIVVIGDSNVAGSGVNQGDMLTEVIEKNMGIKAYPFAPASGTAFLENERFKESIPKMVILVSIEREIPRMLPPQISTYRPISVYLKWNQNWMWKWYQNPLLVEVAIYFDRVINKKTLLRHAKSKFFESGRVKPVANPTSEGKISFFQGEIANRFYADSEITQFADIINLYKVEFEKRGIRFIFLPIPNKESIYYQKLSGQPEPTLLKKLILELQRRGVATVDLQSVYARFNAEFPSELLYDPEETHWNEQGIRVAAQALEPFIYETIQF